jgi:hypothetical protein
VPTHPDPTKRFNGWTDLNPMLGSSGTLYKNTITTFYGEGVVNWYAQWYAL